MVILLDLKQFFNCGSIIIDNKNFAAYKFTVTRLDDLLNKVIPHFDKYHLVGSKQLDYLDFKKAVFLSKDGSRVTNYNLIVFIKNKMNKKRPFSERWYFLNTLSINLKAEWLQAFIDGEGCFQCSIVDTTCRGKPYLAISHTLEIAQSSHDVKVLYAIKEYFGLGYLKPKYDITSLHAAKNTNTRAINRFILTNTESIINFFAEYPLFTRKHLDYLD